MAPRPVPKKPKNPVKPKPASGSLRAGGINEGASGLDVAGWKPMPTVTPTPSGGGLNVPTQSDLMNFFRTFGGGGGGGGGSNASTVNAARQLAWDKQKFRLEQQAKNRQFDAEQKSASEALAAKRGGLDDYIANLTSQVAAGPSGYGQKQEDLLTQLGGIYDTAQKDIGSSQTDFEKSLAGLTNPFAGYQAQAAPTFNTTNLADLLKTQQVGTDPLERLAAMTSGANQTQADAFQNLMNTLGKVYGTSMTDRASTAKQGTAQALSQAALNKASLTSQLRGEQSDTLEKLKKAILDAQLERSQLG